MPQFSTICPSSKAYAPLNPLTKGLKDPYLRHRGVPLPLDKVEADTPTLWLGPLRKMKCPTFQPKKIYGNAIRPIHNNTIRAVFSDIV